MELQGGELAARRALEPRARERLRLTSAALRGGDWTAVALGERIALPRREQGRDVNARSLHARGEGRRRHERAFTPFCSNVVLLGSRRTTFWRIAMEPPPTLPPRNLRNAHHPPLRRRRSRRVEEGKQLDIEVLYVLFGIVMVLSRSTPSTTPTARAARRLARNCLNVGADAARRRRSSRRRSRRGPSSVRPSAGRARDARRRLRRRPLAAGAVPGAAIGPQWPALRPERRGRRRRCRRRRHAASARAAAAAVGRGGGGARGRAGAGGARWGYNRRRGESHRLAVAEADAEGGRRLGPHDAVGGDGRRLQRQQPQLGAAIVDLEGGARPQD